MTALATYTDCQTRWGVTLTAGEITQVGALLLDASAVILNAAGLVIAWTSATLPAAVLPVICAVVRRAFDNPGGLQSETIGDYTWRGNKVGETSSIYLTADEKRTIRRAAAKLGVATVTLTNYLPLPALDPCLVPYMGTEGDLTDVVIVNLAEPVDL